MQGRPSTHCWVVLTMGDRNDDLRRAVASIVGRGGTNIVIVVNGGDDAAIHEALDDQPAAALAVLTLPVNVGIPAGRNAGAEATSGDVIFFLDDDAELATDRLISETLAAFADDETLGVVSFRIAEPDGGTTARRHVPRLRIGDPLESGAVTSFLGGACAIRRRCFDEVGGLNGDFFYAMEETDFGLRAIDHGWGLHYRGDLVVHHPATVPTRHADAISRTAKNRMLIARTLLPRPLGALYVANWTVATALRQRTRAAVAANRDGTRAGRRQSVTRQPIRWRTVWKLTRLGRPPII